ncbi:MAG: acyltransferase [Promethearchaeota archaeon]
MKFSTRLRLIGYFIFTAMLLLAVFVPEVLYGYFLVKSTAVSDGLWLLVLWLLSSIVIPLMYSVSCLTFGAIHSQVICRVFLPKIKPGKYHHDTDEAKLYAVAIVSPAIYKSMLKAFSFIPHLYSMFLGQALRLYGLKCGKNVYLSSGAVLDSHLVEIGDNSFVGMRAIISAHINENRVLTLNPVKIGKNVTIGGYAIIGPGAVIGDNSTVGVSSFVKKNQRIKPNSIYAGIPARFIRLNITNFTNKSNSELHHTNVVEIQGEEI